MLSLYESLAGRSAIFEAPSRGVYDLTTRLADVIRQRKAIAIGRARKQLSPSAMICNPRKCRSTAPVCRRP